MKPDAQVDGVSLFEGDAIGILVDMARENIQVDAIIMDPPYCSGGLLEATKMSAIGQGCRSEVIRNRIGWFAGDNMTTAGLLFLMRTLTYLAATVVKPEGHLLTFLDWRMVPHLIPAMESAGVRWQNLLVWDKLNSGLGMGFRARHEMVAQFTMGSPSYPTKSGSNVLACEGSDACRCEDCNGGMAWGPDAGQVDNVLRERRVPSARKIHQTEKPVPLLKKLIGVTVPEGGVVLDPFGGSGSTCQAANDLGRFSIMVDRNPAALDATKGRLQDGLLPFGSSVPGEAPPLFQDAPEESSE